VTYKANNGTNQADVVENTGLTTNANITIKTQSQTGFTEPLTMTFVGWNTAADGSDKYYTPGETSTINENLVLYAQWVPLTPNVIC
jgi:uncharacterized repeat protein (TIGR02543 family)